MQTLTIDVAAFERIRTTLVSTVPPLTEAVEQLRRRSPADRLTGVWNDFVDDIAGWVNAFESAVSSLDVVGRRVQDVDATLARDLDDLA